MEYGKPWRKENNMSSIDLTGKTAVITGGGGVLCSVFAKALGKCKANVAVLDLNIETATKTAEKIRCEGGIARAYQADVLDKSSLERARKDILEDFGACDILINGAGGNHPKGTTTNDYFDKEDIEREEVKTFFDLDAKGIEFVFNLNFLGTLLPTQVFLKDLIEKDDATVINISSMNAFTPLTRIPAYSGAKAAVLNFTKWLSVHFSKTNMRVNAIAPVFFITQQNERLLINANGEYTDRAKKIISQTPMERFGKPEELIGALMFLISKEASGFVNGVVIPVDGGFSAYSGV